MCGFEFGNPKKLSEEKKHSITFKLKIPILSNMALNLMHMGSQEEECNKLLDNILKLDPKNEKALMRKCNILLDLGKKEECK